MTPKNTPKKNYVMLFNWLMSKIDLDDIENDGMLGVYYEAMKWHADNLANAKYVLLEERDIECLMSIQACHSRTRQEISNITGYDLATVGRTMYKLITRGLAVGYSDDKKKNQYYSITPMGKKHLIELLME